jgi:hypothetical protein
VGPKFSFFCELDTPDLLALLKDKGVINFLQNLQAGVCLATQDFGADRADAVKLLNQAGVPVTAWLILPDEQGYWSNLDNAHLTQARYLDLLAWTTEYELHWAAVGLDIKPDIRLMHDLLARQWRALFPRILRSFIPGRLSKARRQYISLVNHIRADGYLVETYQFPIIVDDRLSHSKIIQRVLGIVNIPADREVLLLYSNFVRPWGAGILWSYGKYRTAVGIGSCGLSRNLQNDNTQPLNWNELQMDLRMAWGLNENLYISNLEGCYSQDILERLTHFEWDQLLLEPIDVGRRVDQIRTSFQIFLWIFSHYYLFVGLGFVIALLLYPLKHFPRKR